MRIGLLDTSLESDNDGDRIIVQSILREVPELDQAVRIPTHRFMTNSERREVEQCGVLVVTGTNILSSRLWQPRQWLLAPRDYRLLAGKVVFLGVGWRQYQANPDALTKLILRAIKHPRLPIAARDEYSRRKLLTMGIEAVNTNCPTMWGLADWRAPVTGDGGAVFTVTDYKKDVARDQEVLGAVASTYQEVCVWPQGNGDAEYLERLDLPANARILGRGLAALDDALSTREYVGTRLHAGIRAAQLGRPSAVIAVDNRALEIGRDTGFPVVTRERAAADWGHVWTEMTGHDRPLTLNVSTAYGWRDRLMSEIGRLSPSSDAP